VRTESPPYAYRPKEPSLPRFPKPFRIQNPKSTPMTTIIAVESKEDIVMCADRQQTSWVKELGEWWSKLSEIGDFGMLGCAGRTDYIGQFVKYMEEGFEKKTAKKKEDMLIKLNRVLTSYSKWVVQERLEDLHLSRYEPSFNPKEYFPEAIFAMRDVRHGYRSFRIFTVDPFGLWIERDNGRAAIGSGGTAGTVFLQTAENLFANYRLKWTDFKTETIGMILSYLLRRISEIDPYSSGFGMFTLGDKGAIPYFPPSFGDKISNLAEAIYLDAPKSAQAKIKASLPLERIAKLLGAS
jgi:20S proteasome alpha/beta subunit